MNKALSRTIFFSILTFALVVPYFNCGAPTDRAGIFGSVDPNDCDASPENLANCKAKVRFGPVPINVQVPAGGGTATVSGTCVSGGFPKVLIQAKAIASNGATIGVNPEMFRCDNGAFYGANVAVPAWVAPASVVLTIYVYVSEESTVHEPITPPVQVAIPLRP